MTPIRETIARAMASNEWSACYQIGRTAQTTIGGFAYIPDAEAARMADAVLRALDEAGLVVVPRDPSRAMLEAATNRPAAKGNSIDAIHTSVYRAMISASQSNGSGS